LNASTSALDPLIGVLNAGSSSLKFAFYEGDRLIIFGQVDGIGGRPAAKAYGANGHLEPPNLALTRPATPSDVLPVLIPWAKEQLGGRRLLRSAIAWFMEARDTCDLSASPGNCYMSSRR
jgi:hypothetical protein